ncbi:General substrate transporter [Niveomyces insectorum RCEF 264]|uniref:General substrate transporter n=1 Tax=Niveomyces insectorum RCEF 264 TaxID=1081102 RepID=A0A167Z968_9HYPO|nr:General substrate transporter [Niveomyces insectorum RCEF 264]
MGGFLTSAPFARTFPSITSDNNATLQGFTVAVYEIGCAIGALSVIVGGDFYGRRLMVMLGETIVIIGAILQATSFGLAQLIVARIVTGIGNGMAVAVLPTWNAECTRATNRGRAVMWQLSINILGICIAYWVDYGVSRSSATADNDWSWRFPLAFQIVFAASTILLAFLLPESPRLLLKLGKQTEARDVVDMLSLQKDPAKRAADTDTMMAMIEHALEEESSAAGQWQDIFTMGEQRFFQRLVLAVMSLCMLQISGVNLITYYAAVIFENTIGMTRNTSLLVTGFNGLEYFLATFIPIPFIDRIGRRRIMLFGAGGCSVCMAVLAATIAYPDSKACGYVAAVFLFLFNTFFAIGLNGIPFLLPVELTPLKTRAKSVAIATGFFWMFNFFVVMISPVLVSRIKYGTYVLWACTNLVFLPLIYMLIPETMRANLEDIDILFERNPTWFIGPGSRKKMKAIIAEREEFNNAHREHGAAKVEEKDGAHFVEHAST